MYNEKNYTGTYLIIWSMDWNVEYAKDKPKKKSRE